MTSLSLQRQDNVKFQKRRIAVERVPCHHGALLHNKTHVEAAPCSEPAARRILPPSQGLWRLKEMISLLCSHTHTHSLAAQWASNSISETCLLGAGDTEARGCSEAPVDQGRRKYLLPTDKKMHVHMAAKHRTCVYGNWAFWLLSPRATQTVNKESEILVAN